MTAHDLVVVSATVGEVAYHVALLRLESPVVGAAFSDLWDQVGVTRWANSELAWKSPIVDSDAEMAGAPPFQRDDAAEELGLCLLAMRRELTLIGFLQRRDTRRRIRAQRVARQRGNTPRARGAMRWRARATPFPQVARPGHRTDDLAEDLLQHGRDHDCRAVGGRQAGRAPRGSPRRVTLRSCPSYR